MENCLTCSVKEIGKCIWDSFLKPHVDYWWCFNNNIQGLRNGIRDLEGKIFDINARSEEARRHLHVVRPRVEEWLNASTHELEEARKILLTDDNIPKAWKLISRYSLGKNAKETADKIAEVKKNGNFDLIADPAPPLAMASPPHPSTPYFESRKGIEEDIIKYLKESSVYVIGICGMGGIGKTSMAQKIGKRVKDENLFDEVVMVTVSQNIEMPKIQKEIIQWLGLKFDEDSCMSVRAHQLRTRLMDPTKKLVILDDLWESLKLDDLGVPFESESCKILLTTRDIDVCKQMEVQKIIAMKILTEQEAWILFKNKTGDCVEGPTLKSMAKDVVAECKGLPLALVTVGLTLRHNTNIPKWKDSLSQLRKSNPSGFPKVLKDVYNPLKLSYDYLDNNREQHLFLLCCLFPEDYHISVEQLTWYSMGLGLFDDFDDIQNIEEARNRTQTLVEKLKSRFLLIDVKEDGKKGLEVKMHDVTRDVAIYIGSKEKNGFLKSLSSIKNSSDGNCNWMSVAISNERMEVPVLSQFPKLQLLMWSSKAFYDISHLSFEGMVDLKVLSFEHIWIGSLPPTLASLKNLQTLRLFRCDVENISVIGKLTSLKILSCYRCANITELPKEIGSLSGLRLLELTRCDKLQRIPFGVISNFRLLEELKMRGSFSRWEAEEKGKERRNASLKELGSLLKLSCLEIEIDDCTWSAQDIRLSQNLVKYYIRIGSDDVIFYLRYSDYEKVMKVDLAGAVGNWIRLLARNAQCLSLIGDGSDNINLAEMENLRNLEFSKCSTVKKLVDTKDGIVFPWLETLEFNELESLEEICHQNQNVSLHNLKSIKIRRCPKLRSLFSVSVARTSLLPIEVLEIERCESLEVMFWNEGTEENSNGCIELPKLKELTLKYLPKLNSVSFMMKDDSCCNLKSVYIFKCDKLRSLFSVSAARTCLLQLELLEIQLCESMEEVFWNEGTDDDTDGCIEFPKLKELTLRNLPNLTAFCQGLENKSIKFPNLTKMRIGGLPKLNSLCPLNSETVVGHDQNTCLHFVCNPKDDSCCNLKSVYIFKCDKLRSLFSVSVARTCLLQLEVLEIQFCESMEEVFWNEGTDDNTDGCIEFPKLKKLTLKHLPNLTALCQELENIIVNFPNLTEMDIGGLPSLKYSVFPLSSEIPCNLKSIKIEKFSNLKHLFTVSLARTVLLQLEVLSISCCDAMEQVFWNEDTDDNTDGCIEFPKLKELRLEDLPNLTAFCQGLENNIIKFPSLTEMRIGKLPSLKNSVFPLIPEIPCNLKSIKIENFSNLKHLFSGSVARTILLQLEVLEIQSCESMEEVFWNEGTEENTNGCIEFPKLKKLRLRDLPNLTAFCQGLENNIIKFPNLTEMRIAELPKLNCLCPLNSETDQNTCLHFVCNPKVEMSCLKDLTLGVFNIRNIWCHQISNNVFNNLESLNIYRMNCIRSLMSTSIAKNLISLKYLDISNCDELVEVIEIDEDDDKQVVDFNCLFPILIQLDMLSLPKLKKFWQWNHALELSSLECVNINYCPIMETFTLGSIITPNIEDLQVNFHEVRDQKDLNAVLRNIWTESQDKSKADGDGNEDED